MSEKIIKNVGDYYRDKLRQYGTTSQGVDWNSDSSQQRRFDVLLNVVNTGNNFSILDYGTGYGAMYEYMLQRFPSFEFTGYDIAREMIVAAAEKYKGAQARWTDTLDGNASYDFVVASGIFNVRLNASTGEWENYMAGVLDNFDTLCKSGFAFNVLTSYSDKEYMKDNLYYADPLVWFDKCKHKYSRNVALLHDYDLYEFTIIVRK